MENNDVRIPLLNMEVDESAKNSVNLYRVVLCGLPDVGKTSIYTRIKDKKFKATGRPNSPHSPQSQECFITVRVNDTASVKVSSFRI